MVSSCILRCVALVRATQRNMQEDTILDFISQKTAFFIVTAV
jgi:hypothetical protein